MFRAVLAVLLLSQGLPAFAGSADDMLVQLDGKANAPTDTWFRFEAFTQEPGKSPREMVFTVQNKAAMRLVDFESPGDMRGTRVLVISRQQMYVYLPAYKKVRRVASHVTEQGFMGTTYSDEDMSTTRFGEVYSATLDAEDDTSATLTLTPRDAQKTHYQKLEMDIRKDLGLPSEIRYFDGQGKHIKTESRGKYDCGEGLCTPGEMTMTDLRRAGAWTRLTVTERQVNQGVPDSTFSVRSLERGR